MHIYTQYDETETERGIRRPKEGNRNTKMPAIACHANPKRQTSLPPAFPPTSVLLHALFESMPADLEVSQHPLNPIRSIISVSVKVVKVVRHIKRSRALGCAYRVALIAVVPDDVGESVQVGQGVAEIAVDLVARVVGVVGAAVQDVVDLVADVAVVAEEEDCADCVRKRMSVNEGQE